MFSLIVNNNNVSITYEALTTITTLWCNFCTSYWRRM